MKNFASILFFLSVMVFVCADDAKPIISQSDQKVLKLKEGDLIVLCGDSITSDGAYPYFLEIYQRACAGPSKVTWKNFGRWGETARVFPPIMDKDVLPLKPMVVTICYGMNNSRSSNVMSDESAEKWGTGEITTVIQKFKEAGVRDLYLASPGCVDSSFFVLSQTAGVNPNAIKATNENLRKLRDSAEVIAKKEGVIFVDMHTPMMEMMAKAKESYGEEFAFAGGKGDGVHPGQAGHLVMAWVYLKAMGYSGDIGVLTVDFAKNTAVVSGGHKVLSSVGGVLELESIQYPFCFSDNPKESWKSTKDISKIFSFNDDLNRYMLVVKNAPAKAKITWGEESKEFDRASLEKGINLAAEFYNNPFHKPFFKVYNGLLEKRRCEGWLAKKEDPAIRKRLETALQDIEIVPVKHQVKIEEIP